MHFSIVFKNGAISHIEYHNIQQILSEDIGEVNCKHLNDDITMSWVVNMEQHEITIELCGCVLVSSVYSTGV